MVDFFEACANNGPNLVAQFTHIKEGMAQDHADTLSLFASAVEQHGRVAINLRPTVLLAFLTLDEYQNIHEYAQEAHDVDNVPIEETLRGRLKRWYDKRLSFDDHFERGKEFKYGSLNIGGTGWLEYGEYCLIFEHGKFCAECTIGYLRGDSLNYFVNDDASIKEAEILSNCADENHKHFLATIKFRDQIVLTTEEEWESLLYKNGSYIEVIFVGTVNTNQLEVLRIPKSNHDEYWELVMKSHRGTLDKSDYYRAETFRLIRKHLQNKGMDLEVTEDA